MARRNLSPDKFREAVRARRTKGSAFSLNHAEYEANQAKVKAELDAMTIAEIKAKYSEYTYDITTPG